MERETPNWPISKLIQSMHSRINSTKNDQPDKDQVGDQGMDPVLALEEGKVPNGQISSDCL